MKIPPQRAETATREMIEQPPPDADICCSPYLLDPGQIVKTREGYPVCIIKEVPYADYLRYFPQYTRRRIADDYGIDEASLRFYQFHAD